MSLNLLVALRILLGSLWLASVALSPAPAGSAGKELGVTVDPSKSYQTMDGFGASLTDSSAWLIAKTLSAEQRLALLKDLFDPNTGIGLSYLRQPIKEVPGLDVTTYVPRGNTALLDAIGRTITTLGETYAAMPENERPERVIVVIQTDGEENASKEYAADAIKAMITEQTSKYSWEFLFLGANIVAFAMADSIGIVRSKAMTFAADGQGARDSLRSCSAYVATSRSLEPGAMQDGFSADDYAKQVR